MVALTARGLTAYTKKSIPAQSGPSSHSLSKYFQNFMLVGMASEISKKYANKCADHSRHREPRLNVHTIVHTFSHCTLDSVVS